MDAGLSVWNDEFTFRESAGWLKLMILRPKTCFQAPMEGTFLIIFPWGTRY
jgi:hypothetical protein